MSEVEGARWGPSTERGGKRTHIGIGRPRANFSIPISKEKEGLLLSTIGRSEHPDFKRSETTSKASGDRRPLRVIAQGGEMVP